MVRSKKQKLLMITKRRTEKKLQRKKQNKELAKLTAKLKKKNMGEIINYNLEKASSFFKKGLKAAGYNLDFLNQRRIEVKHKLKRALNKDKEEQTAKAKE